MYKIIKDKGKLLKAYQLGSENKVIDKLMAEGKICDNGNGQYEVYSLETVKSTTGGEIASLGDYIKIDSCGYPYPNNKEYFEKNHRHIEEDTYEQIPKTLQAWDTKLAMCQEVTFLIEKKGLRIHETSQDQYYEAELWGTKEVAAADAMIVFYSISYDREGNVLDCDWNFVERSEFNRIYSIID